MNHLDAQFSVELSVSDNRVFAVQVAGLTIFVPAGSLPSPVQDVPSDDQGCNDTAGIRFQSP